MTGVDGNSDEVCAQIVAGLLQRMKEAEPVRWGSVELETMSAQLRLVDDVVPRMLRHHDDVTGIMRDMYTDVANKMTPAPRDQNIFRAQVR